MNLLSLVPLPWRIALIAGVLLAFGIVGGFTAWKGYNAGYDKAEALGRSAMATLKSDHDKAYAEAMEGLQTKLQEETRRALVVSAELETERTNNAKKEASLQAKIASVTANSTHVFSNNFVRVWNEAIGAVRGDAMSGAGNSPGADDTPGTSKSPGTGILAKGTVTEADVLAFIIYYGARSKNLEKQVNAFIDLFPQGENRNEPR